MLRAVAGIGLTVALLTAAHGGRSSAAPAPATKPESWVLAAGLGGAWYVRVDGDPPAQVKYRPRPPVATDKKWASVTEDGISGFLFNGGKRIIYQQEDVEVRKTGVDSCHRLLTADPDGANAKVVLTGLKWNQFFVVSPDEKSVVCGAEKDKEWNLYRVPLDGTAPVKISTVAGIDHPSFRLLPDGRLLHSPVTSWHTERIKFGTVMIEQGPVILTDGKTETVLLKKHLGGLPAVTDDVSKMAVYCWPYKDEQAVEVTDLKTGRKERFPVTVFNKDWTHRFGQAVFRPDGKAIVVSLSHTNQVIRAGDDWVQHFGVIWLDGRRERTSVFKVEAPLFKGKFQFCIDRIEWSRGPGPADEPATPPGRAP